MKFEITEDQSEVLKYPRLYSKKKKVGMTKKKMFQKQEPIYRTYYYIFCEPKGHINLSSGEYIKDVDESSFSRCKPDEEVKIESYNCDILMRCDDNNSLYIKPKNYSKKLIRLSPECCPDLDIDWDNRDNYKKITKGSVKISENS